MALTRLTHLDLWGYETHIPEGHLLGISALKELRTLYIAGCPEALTTS